MRADAAKNREHILAVAREALREAGDASMIGIARRAGVGPGTLYRHFPSREALIAAVYKEDVERLVRLVPRLLAEHAPLDALRAWFRTLADFVQLKRGLGEALQSPVQEEVTSAYAPVVSAVGELIAACAADGSMREGLDPEDVLVVMSFMTRVRPAPAAAAQADRAMELAINGLRQP
ncbi:TetR/AcrR family transcriptional regulator [Trebonia sp.]|uniref:TetR/AcrR family transcriptional regulator n=1 Tax=Trebonia sp. TaxID=2767075 RepID=UPI00260D6C52|nr:TetR/AcrR family transcriptional regulator [Trebonia sp.]